MCEGPNSFKTWRRCQAREEADDNGGSFPSSVAVTGTSWGRRVAAAEPGRRGDQTAGPKPRLARLFQVGVFWDRLNLPASGGAERPPEVVGRRLDAQTAADVTARGSKKDGGEAFREPERELVRRSGTSFPAPVNEAVPA